MNKTKILVLFALALTLAGIFSCSDFPAIDIIREEGITFRFCAIPKEGYCLKGPYSVCSKNGEPTNECPYEGIISLTYCVFDKDKLCLIGNFDSCPTGGKVSNGCPWINPEPEEGEEEKDYCVFAADSLCLKGPYAYSSCPESAFLSDNCPLGYEGGYSSSSSLKSSSSLALCNGAEYDPLTQTCLDGGAVTLAICGMQVYDSKTGFCPKNMLNPTPYPRCGEENDGEYDPNTHFCNASGEVQEKIPCSDFHYNPTEYFCFGASLYYRCSEENNGEYNPNTHFCERNFGNTADSLYAKCGGRQYVPTEQFCSGNVARDRCGEENNGEYNYGTHFCERNTGNTADSVYIKCGGRQYIPAEQFCSSGSVRDKCGGEIYNPQSHFCVSDDNELYKKCNGKEYNVNVYTCNTTSGGSGFLVEILHDERDGNDYAVVSLGSQTWMAENMNIATDEQGNEIGKCYDDSDSECDIYGRLYTWAETMALPDECNDEPNDIQCRYSLPRQGICPEGWHVPNEPEWNTLVDYVGGYGTAGRALKAESGWGFGNGWNHHGFTALPGGYESGDSFAGKDANGYWWSASEVPDAVAMLDAVNYNMNSTGNTVIRQEYSKSIRYSVRCLYGDGSK